MDSQKKIMLSDLADETIKNDFVKTTIMNGVKQGLTICGDDIELPLDK